MVAVLTTSIAIAVSTANGVVTPAESNPAPIFGVRVEPVGQSPQQAVLALEEELGGPISMVSEYMHWDETFPTTYHQWLKNSGHRLVLLVKLKKADGTRPSWSSLANSEPGSALHRQLKTWAESIRDFGDPVFFVFHKEPNEPANRPNGTASTYTEAWDKVAAVFDNVGATNASLVFAMAGAIYGSGTVADDWYPGDDVVDVVASSGVNGSCGGTTCNWRTQEKIMAPMVRWAVDHSAQQLGVIEGASVEDPNRPKRKSNWIDNARAHLTGELYERMAFYTYWSSSAGTDFRLTTSGPSTKAGARWINDPLWNP